MKKIFKSKYFWLVAIIFCLSWPYQYFINSNHIVAFNNIIPVSLRMNINKGNEVKNQDIINQIKNDKFNFGPTGKIQSNKALQVWTKKSSIQNLSVFTHMPVLANYLEKPRVYHHPHVRYTEEQIEQQNKDIEKSSDSDDMPDDVLPEGATDQRRMNPPTHEHVYFIALPVKQVQSPKADPFIIKNSLKNLHVYKSNFHRNLYEVTGTQLGKFENNKKAIMHITYLVDLKNHQVKAYVEKDSINGITTYTNRFLGMHLPCRAFDIYTTRNTGGQRITRSAYGV